MQGLEHATPAVVAIISFVFASVAFYIHRARKNPDLFVRRIPGVDAIDEAVGRSAELGRPVMFTTGLTDVSPVLYACLGVLFHVAKKVARYKLRFLLPQSAPDVLAITEEVLRDAYRSAGRLSLFDPKSLMFFSSEQFAFAAGYIGCIQRERPGSAFLFGSFAAESLVLAESGQQVGALQVASTVSPEQVAFFIVTCDYTLIGEELYAASAYLTREPVQLGSLLAQDRVKLLFYLIILAGVVLSTFNSCFPGMKLPGIEFFLSYSWSEFFG